MKLNTSLGIIPNLALNFGMYVKKAKEEIFILVKRK